MRSRSSWKEGSGSRSNVRSRPYLALVLAALFLVSCARVSRWLLVGTWVMTGGLETVEFRGDGTLRTVSPQGTFDGRWEMLDRGTMRVTVRVAAPEPPPREAAEAKAPKSRAGKPAAKTPPAGAAGAGAAAGGKTIEPVVVRFRVKLRTLEVTWPNGERSVYYRPR